LWFTEFGGKIGRITTTGQVTEFSVGLTPGGSPAGITSGPDGNLWFTESSGNRLGAINTVGQITEFSAGISANSSPFEITSGPGDTIWFTELDGNRIARLGLAPQVTSVVVNGGAAQRSTVTQVQISFDEHVVLSDNPADAFRLVRQGDGAVVTLRAIVDDSGDGTIVTLQFAGAATQGTSLADGRFILTALAGQISGKNGALDGDGDGQPGGNFTFGDSSGLFRFFGDANGDQVVNGLDLGLFRSAFGTAIGDANFVGFLDFNGDGVINGLDLGQFKLHFGSALP
jgi:hypothetical protein